MYMYLCVCWCSYCIDCCGCNQKKFWLLDANLFWYSCWSSILERNGVEITVRTPNHAQLSTETTFFSSSCLWLLCSNAQTLEMHHTDPLRVPSALHCSAGHSLQILHWRFEANKQRPSVTPGAGKGVKCLFFVPSFILCFTIIINK